MPRVFARAHRFPLLVRTVVLALVAGLVAFVGTAVTAAPALAVTDTLNVQLSGGPAASVLYGRVIPVSLTAALPAGADKGYNLAFNTVLPAGTAYVPGSAGNDGDPTVYANSPTSGRTTLVWPNVDDLVASSSHTLGFQVTYNDTSSAPTATPKYDVGDQLGFVSGAYISTDPRDETDFDSHGQAQPGTDSYTSLATQTSQTQLSAIQIVKSEPHPEGEIPRGVHDHQTVYTLTITNNDVNPTNGVAVDDWLPAGLEFLGCAGTTDHTTNAPTNPGHPQEYPGSGPITVTHPTVGAAAEKCVVPDLVETVNTDPDGAGDLPTGVYTHVRWNDVGDFAKSQVTQITYAAAIPIRENTMTWSGATPGTTGAQTANLDNNSGPETYDEQPLLNGAIASGAYQSPAKPPLAVSDEGTLLRTAEDIAIQKSNNKASLEQGDLTQWSIDVQVSEYRYVDDLRIHDQVPNGLCPLSATDNLTHAPHSSSDSECAAVSGKGPSAAYTSVDEQGADGTYDIAWDQSTVPSLAHIEPNGTRHLTFWTRTRANYQHNFVDTTPVLSRDSVTNDIDTNGLDYVRCSPDPDCGAGSAKIDHDEADPTDPADDSARDYDVSGSGKAATGPTIDKEVAATYPGSGDCADATYGKTSPEYGPGDLVCWKLRLDFPTNLDTHSQDVFDILPAGIDYVPGSWHATASNTVPIGSIDTSTAGRLHWPIGIGGSDVDTGHQVFEVTIKTTVGSPLGHHSGDVEGNLQKFSYENTPGTAYTLRDRVDFTLKLPELSLLKGVDKVNGGTENGPNVDNVQVQGGDLVTYRVDVTNNGDAAARSARTWDRLPSGITCGDLVSGSISDSGVCDSGIVKWPGVDVAKDGGTKKLTYTVKVPVGVAPGQSFTNTAGVVELAYHGNNGQDYQLVPDNTVVKDPALAGVTPNTPQVQDTSEIHTASAQVAKTRTTSVTEAGNKGPGEATVGERIDYTVTTTIPQGTTIYGSPTVVDPLGSRQLLVPGSLCATACTFDGGAPSAAGITIGEAPANTVTAAFPTSYANTTGHDVKLVLNFSVTVLDVNANTRGSSLTNTATLTYRDLANAQHTPSGTVTTKIVEPQLGLSKSHTPAGPVSGDSLLLFKLRVSNHADDDTTYYSTAHDVVVVDTVPTGTDPVDFGGNPIADGGTVPGDGGTWNAAARTITWTKAATPGLDALAPGVTKELSYQVRLEHAPVGGASYTNVADATTTSLDGTVPGIRSSTSTGSTAPDYRAHATDVLTVALPSLTKDVTPDPVTIGDAVTWHVHVNVPAGVRYYDTTVADTVPDGFDVDGYGATTCVSGCPGGDPAIAAIPPVTNASGTVTTGWFLGDLGVSPANRVYDLVLTGHVRDTYRHGGSKVKDGDTLTNSATVGTDRTDKVGPNPGTVPASFDDTSTPATADSHVKEPRLAIDKSASKGPTVKPGDTVTYTVKVTNNGDWPAYDVVVTDQPDSELTNVTLATGASYNTDGWTAGDPDLRWVVPGPLAAGASVTFTYTAQVQAAGTVLPGATIHNTAAIADYFGEPQADRDAAPGTTWRDYQGPNDSVDLTVVPYADVSIVKHAAQPSYDGGDVITWTIDVTNHGLSPAQNVVVTDPLPAHAVFVSVTPSPTCGMSGGTLTCSFGTIPSGTTRTITLKTQAKGLPPSNTTVPDHTHQLTISKVEQYVTLQAGDSTTVDLGCPGNGYAADGSVEVLHVDQGTGTSADVLVERASSVSPNAYRFVVDNNTLGQAQVKLFATCLPHDTEVTAGHSHGLDVGAVTTLDTGTMTVGRHTFTIPVSSGHQAIAPGLALVSGTARLVGSEPVAGGWQFTVDVLQPARATLSLRELGTKTLGAAPSGHQHSLFFTHVVRTVSLPPGESVQRVTCPDGSKGIVGTYDLPAGVVPLGNEPQPINRDFRLLNTNAGNVDVTLDLECLSIETGIALDETYTMTNAASVTSTTYDPDLSNNSSSDSVDVTLTAGTINQVAPIAASLAVAPSGASAHIQVTCRSAGTCTGTLHLTARVAGHGGHRAHRVVIGTAHYRARHGHRTQVRFTIKHRYRALVRHHHLRSYRVR